MPNTLHIQKFLAVLFVQKSINLKQASKNIIVETDPDYEPQSPGPYQDPDYDSVMIRYLSFTIPNIWSNDE